MVSVKDKGKNSKKKFNNKVNFNNSDWGFVFRSSRFENVCETLRERERLRAASSPKFGSVKNFCK